MKHPRAANARGRQQRPVLRWSKDRSALALV